jgi:NAD(P)-dependent dehydrogenase (short-subunit alcohol dehydrogenase family)
MSRQKIVVITGASSGIGEATTRLLSQKKGFRVYAGVRNVERTAPTMNVQYGRLDVTDDASVVSFIDWVLSDAGRIDVLINNAGVSLMGPVEMTAVDEAQALFDTNVFGPLRMIRAVLPAMRKEKAGLIVNISSVLGFLPAPFMGLYASSKHAIEGLSESLDHEVRDHNIRVVLVQPSWTNTRLDTNTKRVREPLGVYGPQAEAVTKSVMAQIESAPPPVTVAKKILAVVNGPYRMRRPGDGRAKLLSLLWRFMPATLFDSSLRQSFGLGGPRR